MIHDLLFWRQGDIEGLASGLAKLASLPQGLASRLAVGQSLEASYNNMFFLHVLTSGV